MKKMKYVEIPEFQRHEMEEIIENGPWDLLHLVRLSATLYYHDPYWSISVCLSLSDHSDPNVRGIAILGFGYIAQFHRISSESLVRPIVEAGLQDPNDFVRGQANDAADDLEFFLGWSFNRK